MGARLRSWWQQIRQHLVTILVVAIILLVAIAVIIVGYRFDWTGFNGKNTSGKTLWDWLQLLFIPVVLAVAGFWLNHRERKAAEVRAEAEREIEQQRAKTESDLAEDNQREEALQAYIDKMSELLLHEKLRESKPEDEVRTIARVLTLAVVRRCDAERKGSVLLFLQESGLIDKGNRLIDVSGADLTGADLRVANLGGAHLSGARLNGARLNGAWLSKANLSYADLSGANLSQAWLIKADLSYANLSGANLSKVDLGEANLSQADLSQADLSRADLSEANLSKARGTTPEQLDKAQSRKDTIMPDSSKHP